MLEANLFLLFTEPLHVLGMDYMITGSVASVVYGEPRLTHDVDLVVVIPVQQVTALIAAFPEDKFYCPPEEVIRLEVLRQNRAHFNILHHDSGFKADIYPQTNHELHIWGIENRRKITLDEAHTIYVAPPEYVIVRKLEYYREGGSQKHLLDIQAMLAQTPVDLDRVTGWVKKFELSDAWRQATQ